MDKADCGTDLPGVLVTLPLSDFDLRPHAWAAKHVSRLAFTPEQVVAASCPRSERHWTIGCGVYFLQLAGKICYIGLSNQIDGRLNQHIADGSRFERLTVIDGIHPQVLSCVEGAYIDAWQPSWNRAPGHIVQSSAHDLLAVLRGMPNDQVSSESYWPPFTPEEFAAVIEKLE